MSADFTSLIRDLEAAKEGSIELDSAIEAEISEWRNLGGWWREHKVTGKRERFTYVAPPLYTRSVDAALTLVPENWYGRLWFGRAAPNLDEHTAVIWSNNVTKRESLFGLGASAATSSLALCIAALKARSASREARPEKTAEAAAVDTPKTGAANV